MAGHPNPASAQKLAATERRALALALRKQGGTYRKIAETLRGREGISPNYSEGVAYKDVMTELQRLNAENAEAAEEVRRLELERIDELWQVYFAKAKTGDYASFDRCISMMERRARLVGLDKPLEVAANVTGALTVEQWRAEREKRRALADEALTDGSPAAAPDAP